MGSSWKSPSPGRMRSLSLASSRGCRSSRRSGPRRGWRATGRRGPRTCSGRCNSGTGPGKRRRAACRTGRPGPVRCRGWCRSWSSSGTQERRRSPDARASSAASRSDCGGAVRSRRPRARAAKSAATIRVGTPSSASGPAGAGNGSSAPRVPLPGKGAGPPARPPRRAPGRGTRAAAQVSSIVCASRYDSSLVSQSSTACQPPRAKAGRSASSGVLRVVAWLMQGFMGRIERLVLRPWLGATWLEEDTDSAAMTIRDRARLGITSPPGSAWPSSRSRRAWAMPAAGTRHWRQLSRSRIVTVSSARSGCRR